MESKEAATTPLTPPPRTAHAWGLLTCRSWAAPRRAAALVPARRGHCDRRNRPGSAARRARCAPALGARKHVGALTGGARAGLSRGATRRGARAVTFQKRCALQCSVFQTRTVIAVGFVCVHGSVGRLHGCSSTRARTRARNDRNPRLAELRLCPATPRAVSPLRSFLECLVTRSWCLVSPLRPRESENRTFNLRGQPVRNEGATSMPPKLVNYIDKCISRLAARGARATALRLLSRRSQQWRRRPPYLCA